MSVSKNSLHFAFFAWIGYQIGFTLAYRCFPSALTLVLFPPWIAAFGFAFVSLPIAYAHAAVTGYVSYRSQSAVGVGIASTLIAALGTAGFTLLASINLQSVFGQNMILPDGHAFSMSNATANALVRYGCTFFFGAWGAMWVRFRKSTPRMTAHS